MAKHGSSSVVRFVGLLALLAAAGWGIRTWYGSRPATEEPKYTLTLIDPVDDDSIAASAPPTDDSPRPILPAPPEPVAAPPSPPATDAQIAEAARSYREGLARQTAGELVEARGLLSGALASGLLAAADADACRDHLTELAQRLLFSREVHPGDPHARTYRVRPGDSLDAIVRREKLSVPHQGIQRINRISDPRKIRPGQILKLVQGPFDAIITKGSYTLDLYHQGMFVRSFRIGLGQNGSTPTGRWLVRDRVPQAPWTPPATAGGAAVIEHGQPGYPLGTKGYWIALTGLDTSNEMVSGFGIHGTNEPASIGKQASLGCIRLLDPDIEWVYDLLCRGKSKVEVRP